MRKTTSHNRRILNNLMRKSRSTRLPANAGYLIAYAFLYKYLSDKLKNHLMHCIAGDEKDIEFFYSVEENKQDIKNWALDDLGYFIDSYSAFMDQFVADNFVDDIFKPGFFNILRDNIIFSYDNPAQKYFNQIIEAIENQVKFYSINYDEDLNSLMGNFLHTISKLDLSEDEFTFAQVYDSFANSRQIRIIGTPEYISDIISSIVVSEKNSISDAYDPFLNDASILFDLADEIAVSNMYGKEKDNLHYIYSVIKAFIHDFDFNNLFLYNYDSIKSMAVDGKSFDVIVSNVSNRFREMPGSRRKKQSLEVPQNKRSDLTETLLSNLNLDKLSDDKQALEALKVLENRINALEKSEIINFEGEYDSLKDSEFLFLINMINSLNEDGMMVVSLSQNFLFKNSLTLLRKFLTYENNYIDAIISLPEELGRAIRPEVIIVFKKNKRSDDIVFIDLSNEYGTRPSKNAMPGLFKRNLILDEPTMFNIVDAYNKRKTVDNFSEIVSLKDLEKNDFNLTVSRYVDTYEGDFIRLNDLTSDKKEIDRKMDELNAKIDGLLDEMNLK